MSAAPQKNDPVAVEAEVREKIHLEILKRTGAYHANDHVVLPSGQHTSEYIEKTLVTTEPSFTPKTELVYGFRGLASSNENGLRGTATLGVTKSSLVITDNLVPPSANPKAIPGATVEYTISIANTGSQPATLQTLSDAMPAATAFRADDYPGAMDVSIQVDANPVAYCTSDADADGCVLTGTTLTVGAPAITSVAAGSTVVVKFRVTIN